MSDSYFSLSSSWRHKKKEDKKNYFKPQRTRVVTKYNMAINRKNKINILVRIRIAFVANGKRQIHAYVFSKKIST